MGVVVVCLCGAAIVLRFGDTLSFPSPGSKHHSSFRLFVFLRRQAWCPSIAKHATGSTGKTRGGSAFRFHQDEPDEVEWLQTGDL